MKKILILFALILTMVVSAQTTCTPSYSSEFCPSQNYTFTVAGLPANFTFSDSSPGITFSSPPTGDTTVTFTAQLADKSGTQWIKLYYGNSGVNDYYYLYFNNVKTLFGGYFVGNPNPITSLTIPLCQTTPINLNLYGDQYYDQSNNSSTFGAINNYVFFVTNRLENRHNSI